jgi:hypothetical protein
VAAAKDAAAHGEAPPPAAVAAAVLHSEQIYHAQCTYVLRDAQVTERELALLRNLRTQLGLSEEQARRIEQEVEHLLKVDAPQTGASAAPEPPAVPTEPAPAVAAASPAGDVAPAAGPDAPKDPA